MNKAPIKAIKKETASLLASLFFIALEVGILRMPANERRSREIGAYTIDLLSQDNVVSKRKIPVELRFYGFFCCMEICKRAEKNNEQYRKAVAG
ncbi:hypothetical protein, partial [Blautia sp.]|uniref:hypothetical protein n=1 Tax=Blautia sp. TaxID=1955243 RepID=UPI003A925EA5